VLEVNGYGAQNLDQLNSRTYDIFCLLF